MDGLHFGDAASTCVKRRWLIECSNGLSVIVFFVAEIAVCRRGNKSKAQGEFPALCTCQF